MLQFLVQLLASIMSFFQQKQLLDAGAALKENETLKAENEAITTAKNIKATNARLNVVTITDKLRKYERD